MSPMRQGRNSKTLVGLDQLLIPKASDSSDKRNNRYVCGSYTKSQKACTGMRGGWTLLVL